ncbi:STAS/SEC14 domain-containing protein, partial [Autumnicola edwardsiae]|uniref:STAS/SEC14 domain-containing protein n=1 Tax=Autumnicola edwardsiae TaxID=3075594 RepID=UPI0032C24552
MIYKYFRLIIFRLLLIMENFEGWTASAYWKSIELKLPNEERVKKVALVGNTKWKEQFTEVLIPFTRAHIKFF